MGPSRLLQVVSATVMLAGLAAALLLCNNIIQRERAELQRTTAAESRQVAAGLQAGVISSVEPLERLGRWWLSQGKPATKEDWRTDGQLFLSRSPGLRQASWVGRDGYREWLAVPGSDPLVRRTLPDDRVRQLIAAAQSRRALAISEVFDTPGIDSAFYVCFPLTSDGKHVRGYVLGLYDAKALLAPLARSGVRSDQQIVVSSEGRLIFSTFPGSRPAPGNAVVSFDVAQRLWTVGLYVPLNYFREFRGLIFTMAGVVGAMIYSFSTLLYFSQRRSLALQRAYGEVRDLNRDLHRRVVDFETLLDVSPIGIAVTDDPECRNIRANLALAHMLGVPREANLSQSASAANGSGWRMLRDGRSLSPDEMPMQVAAATGNEVLGEEYQIVRGDGSVIDVLSFAAPLFDEHGRVRGGLHACVDISERKAQEQLRRELEQDLQRAQRMKSLGAMAAGIAHDFNNLLTGIIGQASLAEDSLPPDSTARERIAASLKSAEQAARLIAKVLAFTGHSYHTLRPTDLGQLLTACHADLDALAAPKAEVRLSIAPHLPPVMGDQNEIRHILHNLVLNAVEATAAGRGAIEICVDPCQVSGEERNLALPGEGFVPGAYVRIMVKDSGSGMPAEIAEQAFDPFFSTKFLGRGLGLAEVLGIMRAHKGAVRLETVPDEGTSVILFFPAGEKSASRAA